jgi:monoamine oxidase
MKPILIIGGGLSGLTLAFRLEQLHIPYLVLEATDRLGGRVRTEKLSHSTWEAGATWFGKQHTKLNALLTDLQLQSFPQYDQGKALFEAMSFVPPQEFDLPPNPDPSYRISNGTATLIAALAKKIPPDRMVLDCPIRKIEKKIDHIQLTDTHSRSYIGAKVAICVPPAIAASSILFIPNIASEIQQTMKQTQTWMAESIKFAIQYPCAFWRESGFSGTVFSQTGPITEAYDHNNNTDSQFVIKGFLHGSLARMSMHDREKLVVAQLVRLLGEEAKHQYQYADWVWRDDPYVFTPYPSFQIPHQHAGHAIYQEMYWNNTLFFASSETATSYGGYMEGAVVAAQKWAIRLAE